MRKVALDLGEGATELCPERWRRIDPFALGILRLSLLNTAQQCGLDHCPREDGKVASFLIGENLSSPMSSLLFTPWSLPNPVISISLLFKGLLSFLH